MSPLTSPSRSHSHHSLSHHIDVSYLFVLDVLLVHAVRVGGSVRADTGGREVKRAMSRCPGGSTRAGSTCVNVDECVHSPCLHGGTCVDREPARRYDCICPFGYTGHDCQLELLASGIIMPSRDFVIAIIVCLFLLLGEHFYYFACFIHYVIHKNCNHVYLLHISGSTYVFCSIYLILLENIKLSMNHF